VSERAAETDRAAETGARAGGPGAASGLRSVNASPLAGLSQFQAFAETTYALPLPMAYRRNKARNDESSGRGAAAGDHTQFPHLHIEGGETPGGVRPIIIPSISAEAMRQLRANRRESWWWTIF